MARKKTRPASQAVSQQDDTMNEETLQETPQPVLEETEQDAPQIETSAPESASEPESETPSDFADEKSEEIDTVQQEAEPLPEVPAVDQPVELTIDDVTAKLFDDVRADSELIWGLFLTVVSKARAKANGYVAAAVMASSALRHQIKLEITDNPRFENWLKRQSEKDRT